MASLEPHNVGSLLDQYRAAGMELTDKELIEIGEESSGGFYKFVKAAFGFIKPIETAVNEHYIKNAVELIKQQNLTDVVIGKIFKEANFNATDDEMQLVQQMVPDSKLLLETNADYEKIKDWTILHALQHEIADLGFNAPNDHWMNHFFYKRDDLSNFLASEQLPPVIFELNALMKKEDLSQADFANVLREALKDRPLSEVKAEDLKSLEKTLEYLQKEFKKGKPSGFKPDFLHSIVQAVPPVLHDKVGSIATSKLKFQELGAEDTFNELLKGAVRDVTTFPDFVAKMNSFTNLPGQVKGSEVKDLYNFYISGDVDPAKVKSLEGLQTSRNEYNVSLSKKARDIFSDDKAEAKLNALIDPVNVLANIENIQKLEFKSWLSKQGFKPEDEARINKFYENVLDEKIYDAKVLANALKVKIEEKKSPRAFMDEVFPTFLGMESDPADVIMRKPSLMSKGKLAILEQCFKENAKEAVRNVYGENIPLQTDVVSLFKKTNILPEKEAYSMVSDLFTMVAILEKEGHSSEIIMKEVKARQADFYGFDVDKMNEERGELQPVVLQRIAENVKKESELEAVRLNRMANSSYNAIKRDPNALISAAASTFIVKLFPDNAKIDEDKIKKAVVALGPIINPMIKEGLSKADPEFINSTVDILKETNEALLGSVLTLGKTAAKEFIAFDTEKQGFVRSVVVKNMDEVPSIVEEAERKGFKSVITHEPSGAIVISFTSANPIANLVNTVVSANEAYRKAKLENVDLKKADDAYFEKNHISAFEKWLLVGLGELSEGVPMINTLANRIPNFIQGTGVFTEKIAGIVAEKVVASFLEGNQNLTKDEKKNLAEGAKALAEVLLPIIPELKNKHNIEMYTKFIQDFNALIHSDKPITGEMVVDVMKPITTHFLNNELDQYKEPLFAAMQSIPNAL